MAGDLDKLMNKLKNGDDVKIEEVPQTAPTETPTVPTDDEFNDDLIEEEEPTPEKVEETLKAEEPKKEDSQNSQHQINGEVALFQNSGIFRRELLLKQQERNDVLKVIAQCLIDLNKKFEADGKKSQ